MLPQWNEDFEAGLQTLPPEAWDRWLWQSPMHEKLTPDVMLNESHLLGLLISRYRARYSPEAMDFRMGDLWPMFVHGSQVVKNLTLRQLRDSLEDLQMHFSDYSADWEHVGTALDALLARFGTLNLEEQDSAVLNDVSLLDGPGQLSLPCIRRFTVLFAVLYRHVYLASVAEYTAELTTNGSIEHCHVEAGLDNFHRHCMHADIPPAARIIYEQDFAGMYSSVTQVVYYHFRDYERRQQLPLDDVRAGQCLTSCLSVALELYPDIPVVYEDDTLPTGWAWMLLAGGALYLVSPVVHGKRAAHTGPCIWTLLQIATL